MIRIGYPIVGFFADEKSKIQIEGKLVFRGYAQIGSGSSLVISKDAVVDLGRDFAATANLKLWSVERITFGSHTLVGWNCTFLDTNAHKIYDVKRKKFKKAKGAIQIGDNNWFAAECKVLHSVSTPDNCIFSMDSIVTKSSEIKSECIMGGNPAKILAQGFKRIPGNDTP